MTSVASNTIVHTNWRHICPIIRDLTFNLDTSTPDNFCIIEIPRDLRIQGAGAPNPLWLSFGQQNGFLCRHEIIAGPPTGELQYLPTGWLYIGGPTTFSYRLILNGETSQEGLITIL